MKLRREPMDYEGWFLAALFYGLLFALGLTF
jgi:hypothetical protein